MQRSIEGIVKDLVADWRGGTEAVLGLFEGEIFRKEAVLQGLPKQLGHIANFEPPHQIESMHLDRPDADRQAAGNVSVGIALRHQFQNFFLSRRQAL